MMTDAEALEEVLGMLGDLSAEVAEYRQARMLGARKRDLRARKYAIAITQRQLLLAFDLFENGVTDPEDDT